MKRKCDANCSDWRPKKRKRVAAYTWLRFVDNTLEWSTGAGLSQFQMTAPRGQRPDPFAWRRLQLAPDQGSDGVCATNMMMGPLRVNLFVTWDLSHAIHNDIELSLQSSNLWVFMMVFVVVANVPCAPWNENKRWQQARGVMESFYERVRPQDSPLFMSLQSALMDELDIGSEVLSADRPEELLWDIVHKASP